MGTAFAQQGQYKRDVFVQLHYLNDENMVKIGCTWPGKQSKLTCSSRGYISNYTKKVPAKLQEDWEKQLQFQCVPPPCVCQVYIYFSNSEKLQSKVMSMWTPMSHTFHLKSKGNAHNHGLTEHNTNSISTMGTALICGKRSLPYHKLLQVLGMITKTQHWQWFSSCHSITNPTTISADLPPKLATSVRNCF